MKKPYSGRQAGVLLHITSLPSGTFADALRWLDFLTEAGFGVWQVLPFGDPLSGLSPYQCGSEFAINPAFLSSSTDDEEGFASFCQQNSWLDDYARFLIIKKIHQQKPWYQWSERAKWRDATYLADIDDEYKTAGRQIKFKQFQLYQTWHKIKHAAKQRNIQVFGDMPFFVAHDSVEVWSEPEYFSLSADGTAAWQAGVPPDYFSKTGQLWGNPQYNWQKMQQDGFGWWHKRLKNQFELFDLVRIDHFRGLAACWMIPSGAKTAEEGHWQEVPGAELLKSLEPLNLNQQIIAEDLGVITDDVRKLKQDFNLPGMSILQFAFDHHEDNPHKPQNISENTVVYTGTHDNETLSGWCQQHSSAEQKKIRKMLGIDGAIPLNQAIIEQALATKAKLAILPLQDMLELDNSARMNTPGQVEDCWQWRFDWHDLRPDLAQDMRKKLAAANRLVQKFH